MTWSQPTKKRLLVPLEGSPIGVISDYSFSTPRVPPSFLPHWIRLVLWYNPLPAFCRCGCFLESSFIPSPLLPEGGCCLQMLWGVSEKLEKLLSDLSSERATHLVSRTCSLDEEVLKYCLFNWTEYFKSGLFWKVQNGVCVGGSHTLVLVPFQISPQWNGLSWSKSPDYLSVYTHEVLGQTTHETPKPAHSHG